MKKLIISAVLLGALAFGGSKLLLHSAVESAVDDIVTSMSPFAAVEYRGVSSTMGGKLTIDGIVAQPAGLQDKITIERLGIDTPSYFWLIGLQDIAADLLSGSDEIPEYVGVMFENVRLQLDADYVRKMYAARKAPTSAADADEPAAVCTGKYGFSPAALQKLGYTEQLMSASAYMRHERSSYSLTFHSAIENMWDLNVELTMAGSLLAEIMKGPRARPKLSAMRVEYQDHSLNERVFDYCEQLGMTKEQVVAAQLDKLRHYGQAMGIEFDDYVIEPYTEFLEGKSTLVVTAKPREPVSLAQIGLYKPSDVPALLDLTAETL